MFGRICFQTSTSRPQKWSFTMATKNISSEIGLVFAQHKSGSSTVMQAFREVGLIPERGYAENARTLLAPTAYACTVTPVRDPVAQRISHFFEINGAQLMTVPTMDMILDRFFVSSVNQFGDWFTNVFQPMFGVNVYKTSFPKVKGWKILDGRYLLIQMEQLTKKLPVAFEEMFGKRPPPLHRAKTLDTRNYGHLYAKFVNWAKFSKGFLDNAYGQKYVKHFYSPKQIEKMRSRWEK